MPKHTVTISVSQALLLLIKNKNDQTYESKQLKKLYFLGANTPENRALIEKLLKDPMLADYHVSMTNTVINEDASRRYFETQLALHTLKTNLKYLESSKLKQQLKALEDFLPTEGFVAQSIDTVFQGKTPPNPDNFAVEYADLFAKLNDPAYYQDFSSHEKNKLILLAKASYLFLNIAQTFPELPLKESYQHSIFDKIHRGRRFKQNQKYVNSHHFGLMKNTMPLARNDVAYAHGPSTHLRPADSYHVDYAAAWPIETFKHLVHPFSCSISGTTIASVRVLKALHEENKLPWDNIHSFLSYYRCYFSLMLFHSGGHSFFEFASPLFIPEVKSAFDFIIGYEILSLETLMLSHNQTAYDEAFKLTIEYNDHLLKKQNVHGEITLKAHQDLLDLIQQVKAKILHCNSKTKQSWLTDFQQEVGSIAVDAQLEKLDKEEIKARLQQLLDDLEKKNKDYYQSMLFFSSRRQKNSSLGQHIDAARRLLN